MPRVLISAAHTLQNPGEIFRDLREADITRKMVQKTIPYLEKKGIEFQAVPLDLDLLKRIEWINSTGYTEENGDIFVEIHVNDGGKRGIEGWYQGNSEDSNKSKILADSLLSYICTKGNFENQGAKSEYEHELGSLLILNQTKPISIAIECLYIDNEEDIKILKDDKKLDDLGKLIADAIDDYLKNKAGKPVPSVALPKAPASQKPTMQGGSFPSPVPSFNPPGGFTPGASLGGGGAFSSMSTGGFGGDGFGGAIKPSNPSLMMDREQRKDMIVKTYQRILGKEPNQNDLNQNLNTGVTEEQLVKKLVDSKEHEQLVEDAKSAVDLKNSREKSETEIEMLKSKIRDIQIMLDNLNKLLQHKNYSIEQMRQEMIRRGVLGEGQYPNTTANRR